jgi:hypothetical protein
VPAFSGFKKSKISISNTQLIPGFCSNINIKQPFL